MDLIGLVAIAAQAAFQVSDESRAVFGQVAAAAQIEQILAYQTEHKMLFGEAAVALRMVEGNDVMWALSQQFHYPYAANGRKHLNTELVVATKPFSDISLATRVRSAFIRS